jgi:hypothetical protein
VKDLKNEFFPARPEAGESEPVRLLKREFFPVELALRDKDALRDLRREFFAATLEDKARVPDSALK